MHILDNVSERINRLLIRYNTFNNIGLNLFNILNISDKISVGNLFSIGASGIFSTKNINENLISNKIKIIKYSDELLSGNKGRFSSIIVL